MFFFHDECDLIDEDQYDLFTLTTHIERKSGAASAQRRSCAQHEPELNRRQVSRSAGQMAGQGIDI
jgi:hypothetical protein